ncbi:MAG: hypothetical protein RMK97_04190 [Sutterellaceae bacterium]|nr:hypothetical protein [Burkholderiaceae bacterium]MDW8429691.1 hypothetical protein [Sutterellaceae bacterium]
MITAAADGLTSFSADVRNRWPDGSVKWAVLSGTVNLAAGQPITLALQAAGSLGNRGADLTLADLKATNATASIGFGGALATWAGSDWDRPHSVVQLGPTMSSWVYRKPLGSDPHLVAWLEVRLYRGGAVEVMPWIENGYLNVVAPGSKSGRATFSLGGTKRYDSSDDASFTSAYGVPVVSNGVITMPHHTRIVLVSGGRHSHWLGNDPSIFPLYSRSYWESTRLTPAYLPASIDAAALNALNLSYSPMRHVYQEQGMGGAGDDGHNIGLLPKSSVFFLVGNSPIAYRAMIANALALGSYCIHYRDETTGRPLRFADYPNLTINSGTGMSPPTPSGTAAYLYALTHHGAACYLPYLVTGWNWFVEEMQFQTTLHYLAQTPAGRNYANYLMSAAAINYGPGIYSNAGLRGLAWQWRTCAMTASCTPDSDSLREQFITAIGYNAWYRRNEHETGSQGRRTAPNIFGFNVEPAPYNQNGYQITAPWSDDFITQAVGLTWDLEVVTDPARRADLRWYRDFKYRCPVGRAGAQNDVNEYNYRWYHAYQLAVGPFTGENFTWFTSWRQLFEANWGMSNTGLTGTEIVGGPGLSTLFNISYAGDMYAALVYAVEHGAPGAAAALARIQSASNYGLMISAANTDGRRAFKVRT